MELPNFWKGAHMIDCRFYGRAPQSRITERWKSWFCLLVKFSSFLGFCSFFSVWLWAAFSWKWLTMPSKGKWPSQKLGEIHKRCVFTLIPPSLTMIRYIFWREVSIVTHPRYDGILIFYPQLDTTLGI